MKAEVEEANGSSSGEGGVGFPLTFFMEVNKLALEEQSLHHDHACLGGQVWLGKWRKRTVKGTEEADLSSADMEAGERICRSRCVQDP